MSYIEKKMEYLLISFNDLEPYLELDETEHAAAIEYDETYLLCIKILFSVMHINEVSERVLYLTEELLSINPAHYTAWQYRRKCLTQLKNTDLVGELKFMDEFSGDNPKNYQIWYHRRALVQLIGESSVTEELEFTERVFAQDTKNYHAWTHRQFLLLKYQIWDKELEIIDKCIDSDIRNNSAWNHRWLVLFGRYKDKSTISFDTISSEVEYVFTKVYKVKNNESAWNYLAGILSSFPASFPIIKTGCEVMVTKVENARNCIYLLAMLVEILEQEGTAASKKRAFMWCNRLAIIDAIRVKYWKRRGLTFNQDTVA